MNPKPSSDSDVGLSGDDRQFITRREFGRVTQSILEKIDDIPKALRAEFMQNRPQGATIAAWVTAVLLVIFALCGALVSYINSARDYDRLSFQVQREADKAAVNMRFELEHNGNAEYHRLAEQAQQQVWRQQNSGQERLENRIDGWDRDMRQRYFDRVDEVPEPAPDPKPHKRKK